MPRKPSKPKLQTMNVSLPASLRTFVGDRVEDGGFGNVSEFVRHLIREDMDRVEYERRHLRKMLDEGDRSGPPIEADEKFWARLRELARSGGARGRRKAG